MRGEMGKPLGLKWGQGDGRRVVVRVDPKLGRAAMVTARGEEC